MKILPVNALVYNQEKVSIDDVIAPPYDVIDNEYRENLYNRSLYNIVRLILSKEQDPYSDAAANFTKWQNNKILVKTEKPAIFYIVQKYRNEHNKEIERKGFIARNLIEDFSLGNILPHEYTMGGPKQDRLNLVNATGAFFSQIFMVYNDKTFTIENEVYKKCQKPFIDTVDDNGVRNIVYLIDNENDIEIIQNVLSDKKLLIADGHHRYETSMNYSKQHPENDYAKYVMSYFTNAADENLVIYPTHRIIEKDFDNKKLLNSVDKYYDIEIINNKDDFLTKIEEENNKQITTGLILKNNNNYYILKLKKDIEKSIDKPEELQQLDLTVLHELILKKELQYTDEELMSQNGIKYEKKENVAFNSVKNSASACFIMAYPKMKDILNISSAGYRMPQKSTYFYPKLLSGIVINKLN